MKLPSGKAVRPIRKIRIKENTTTFEAATTTLSLDDENEWVSPTPKTACIELATREGFALERLTKDYFEHEGGMNHAYNSVEYVLLDRDNLEIDVVAERRNRNRSK